MSIKFDDLEPGMVVYDIHQREFTPKFGASIGCWKVRIISINKEARTVLVSWNGQKPKTLDESKLSTLYKDLTPEYVEQKKKSEERTARLRRDHDWDRPERRTKT